VIPPGDFATVAPRLRSDGMGAQEADHPEFQIGDGCLTDQLLGDSWAQLTGIGTVFDAGHVRTTLDTIHQLNYVPDFANWTNYMRTYAVHGERGHIVMSYPDGLPEHPMPYWPEVWTGLEYAYAIGLIQQGRADLAQDVVAAARERFTGRRRNPFDEAECGHHYARAMASWGLVVALTGFRYDGRHGLMTFAQASQPTRWFWSTGYAWGTVQQSPDGPGGHQVELEVLSGSVRVEQLTAGELVFRPKGGPVLEAGGVYEFEPAS
jgi:non-lysosomal glucosylceramidase